jgi:hypothetical protein
MGIGDVHLGSSTALFFNQILTLSNDVIPPLAGKNDELVV